MKTLAVRLAAVVILALAAWALSGASGSAPAQPDKLVILSTTDVKGRTGPCG